MTVDKRYEPLNTPDGYLFYSHVNFDTDAQKAKIAKDLKVPESAIRILPEDTLATRDGGSKKFSAFVWKVCKPELDAWHKEVNHIMREAEIHVLAAQMLSPKFMNLAYPKSFNIPLTAIPLGAKFSFDIETGLEPNHKKESAKMKNGDKVTISWGSVKLKGTFITEFWDSELQQYFATVRLNEPFAFRSEITGIHETVNFLNPPMRNVTRYEPDGVKLNFPHVKWSFSGETQTFNISETTGRAFAAMARVDKIEGIKSFRARFKDQTDPTGVRSCGLKTAKDVIEALVLWFPR